MGSCTWQHCLRRKCLGDFLQRTAWRLGRKVWHLETMHLMMKRLGPLGYYSCDERDGEAGFVLRQKLYSSASTASKVFVACEIPRQCEKFAALTRRSERSLCHECRTRSCIFPAVSWCCLLPAGCRAAVLCRRACSTPCDHCLLAVPATTPADRILPCPKNWRIAMRSS